jgi:hypothetical protein
MQQCKEMGEQCLDVSFVGANRSIQGCCRLVDVVVSTQRLWCWKGKNRRWSKGVGLEWDKHNVVATWAVELQLSYWEGSSNMVKLWLCVVTLASWKCRVKLPTIILWWIIEPDCPFFSSCRIYGQEALSVLIFVCRLLNCEKWDRMSLTWSILPLSSSFFCLFHFNEKEKISY